MIGILPTSLDVAGREYPINSDYRIGLIMMVALNDPELSSQEKAYVLVKNLYCVDIPNDLIDDAIKKAVWYLDGGKEYKKQTYKVMDWEQDESMIFSSINKIACKEIRLVEYMHWWTFLGYFNEIGEGLYTNVLSIRQKKAKNKKLEKYERDFYNDNKDLVDLRPKISKEDQELKDKLLKML